MFNLKYFYIFLSISGFFTIPRLLPGEGVTAETKTAPFILPYPENNNELSFSIDYLKKELRKSHIKNNPILLSTTRLRLADKLYEANNGNRGDNVEKAIRYYRLALKSVTNGKYAAQKAAILNNLAVACLDRSLGNQIKNVEAAILCLRKALRIWTYERYPEKWAMLQHNLATAYLERTQENADVNIEAAINCYQAALKVRTPGSFPEKWAATKNSMGNAFLDWATGDVEENIETAIQYYQDALAVRTEGKYPKLWSSTRHNLGLAYSKRIRGDCSSNIEMAIQHYKKALRYRSKEKTPWKWASTHKNRGELYLKRLKGDRSDNIETAIHHLKRALKVYLKKKFPDKWAATINSLALANQKRLKGNREKNLDVAIQYYRDALSVKTRQQTPIQWASIRTNLASVFMKRKRGNPANNQEKAIHNYIAAAAVFTKNEYPEQWASIQYNLAGIYSKRINGQKEHNFEIAGWYFERALKFRTADKYPAKYRRTMTHFADHYFKNRQWEKAQKHYSELITMFDGSAYSGAPIKIRNTEWKKIRTVYANLAFCYCKLNNPIKALEILEQEKQLFPRLSNKKQRFSFKPDDFRSACAQSFASPEKALIEMTITSQGTIVLIYNQAFPGNIASIYLPDLTSFLLHDLMFKDRQGYIAQYYLDKEKWYKDIRDHLSYIGELFWQRLHEVLQTTEIKQIVLVPQSYLALIPLHATPFYDFTRKSTALPVDYYDLVFMPGASEYFELGSRQGIQPAKREALFVENPEGDLSYSLSELSGVSQLFREKGYSFRSLNKSMARSDSLTAILPTTRLFHFYGHGSFDPMQPSGSGLFMAPVNGKKNLFTIKNLQENITFRNAPLVVLSACETGLSNFINLQKNSFPEFPQAFLAAGSKTVIASLWEVPNLATSLLFLKFYDELLIRKNSPAASLRKAQRWLKSATRRQIESYLKRMVSRERFPEFQNELKNYGVEQRDKYVFLGLKNMVKELNIGAEPDKCPFAHTINWAGFYLVGHGFQPFIK